MIFLLAAVAASDSPSLGAVGLGSNVVDRFYRVRGEDGLAPIVGVKGYFAAEGEVVGGVTLNLLSWAQALGVPTALAALQGEDEAGRMIRAAMGEHGISADVLTVTEDVASSVSHVILDESGERTILMAPHATATLTAASVEEYFAAAVARSSLITTEISQVPLDGVTAYMQLALENGIPTVLDVDVPPSVAASAAKLCEKPEDALDCAKLATVLKATRPSAEELIRLAAGPDAAIPDDPAELAAALQAVTRVQLVAVTAGSSGGALAAAGGAKVSLPPPEASINIVDSTGAGDAFMGGLLAALWRLGNGNAALGIASAWDEPSLLQCLQVANCAGAACCEVLGGLPPLGGAGKRRVEELLGDAAADALPAAVEEKEEAAVEGGGGSDDGEAASVMEAAIADSFKADAATASALVCDEALVSSLLEASASIAASRAAGAMCLVTGIGKSGAVARRLAASLASTGCPAHFVHAAEWAHGDLGNMPFAQQSDEEDGSAVATLIAISHSGRTAEVVGACKEATARGVRVVLVAGGGISGAAASPAGDVAAHVLGYTLPDGVVEPYGGAPTASIVAQEAVANALVRSLADADGFDSLRFRSNHPGGALGESLKAAE